MAGDERGGGESAVRRSGLASLDAYRVAVEFYRLVLEATRTMRGRAVKQLQNSAESIVLNVAEAYPTFGADRARRFQIAANEASESFAALDVLEIRGQLRGSVLAQLHELLDRERAMLWRLSARR